MALSIHPITKADVPRVIDIFWAAMKPSGLFRATGEIPNLEREADALSPPARRDIQIARILNSWGEDRTLHILKVVDDESGDIIAFAKWHVFHGEGLTEWTTATRTGEQMRIPLGANEAGFRYCYGKMFEKRKEFFGESGRENCLLALLATDPAHERRGAGSLLVQWGCDVADRHGIECYLEASKKGYPVYKKLGFEESSGPTQSILHFDVSQFTGRGNGNGDWVHLITMVRKPRGRAEEVD